MRRILLSLLSILALVFAMSAFAEENVNSDDMNQQPGMSSDQSQMQDTKMKDSAMMKKDAKMELAPHTVMIQSSLQSVKQQINGLRTQLEAQGQNPANQQFVAHYKMLSKEIKDGVNMAKIHENELEGSVKSFPKVAQSDNLRKIDNSIQEVVDVSTNWEQKSTSADYWNNPRQVKTDLDNLEKRIDNAINSTKTFNKAELDLRAIG